MSLFSWARPALRSVLWSEMRPIAGPEYICSPLLPTFFTHAMLAWIVVGGIVVGMLCFVGWESADDDDDGDEKTGCGERMACGRHTARCGKPNWTMQFDGKIGTDADCTCAGEINKIMDELKDCPMGCKKGCKNDKKNQCLTTKPTSAGGKAKSVSVSAEDKKLPSWMRFAVLLVLWTGAVVAWEWEVVKGVKECLCFPCVVGEGGVLMWPLLDF